VSQKVNCWAEILGKTISEIKFEENGTLTIWFEDRWIELESTDSHQTVQLYELIGEPALSGEVLIESIIDKKIVKVRVPYILYGKLYEALVSVHLEDGTGFRIGSEADYYPIRIS